MLTLLKKEYDSESIVDAYRDITEAFDSDFTPAVEQIPQDEYGFCQGTFVISIEWKPNENS